MLKIKDNIDLKELEKFGFKPKYDIDTGKLKKYVRIGEIGNYFETTQGEWIEIILDTNSQYQEFWRIILCSKIYKAIDLLYDLIQAGLVEKI